MNIYSEDKMYESYSSEVERMQKCIDELQQENKILRENAVADYETTMSELQELKKQVEEYKDNYNCLLKQKEQFEYIMSKQVDYQGQQKEFMKFLEDEIKSSLALDTINKQTAMHIYSTTLRKYKSIIGVSDDKTN